MTLQPAERGDLCEIHWVDINEEPVGDPNKAGLSHRVSYGLYWSHIEEQGIPCIVTTTTTDPSDLSGQQGYCIYPEACVTSLTVVRKARKPRVKRARLSSLQAEINRQLNGEGQFGK
jgi:hypothetical protein